LIFRVNTTPRPFTQRASLRFQPHRLWDGAAGIATQGKKSDFKRAIFPMKERKY
jgi:hypothetical protein